MIFFFFFNLKWVSLHFQIICCKITYGSNVNLIVRCAKDTYLSRADNGLWGLWRDCNPARVFQLFVKGFCEIVSMLCLPLQSSVLRLPLQSLCFVALYVAAEKAALPSRISLKTNFFWQKSSSDKVILMSVPLFSIIFISFFFFLNFRQFCCFSVKKKCWCPWCFP